MAERTSDRDESESEKLDRNWNDMFQELRVVQTGVRLFLGFLLTLPFIERFKILDVWQEWLYLALVVTAGLVVGATLIFVMVYRRLFGQQVKGWVVVVGYVFFQVVMGLFVLIIVGICMLIFSVVLGWLVADIVAVLMAAVLVVLLVVVPLFIGRCNVRS